MDKDLERDLGLVSVLAISIGAMVGSGIFILPALAVKEAGSGMIVAYALAGVLVLPAALSKAEMATAMPEAGGTYVYIERAMGPILGSIAGIGTWFSLSFKGALALVGGVPYLLLVLDLPKTEFALALALVLILVNLVGAKQTGRLQVAIVCVMLLAMIWFVVGGAVDSDPARFQGLFDESAGGIFAATGLVFVSFAGVTKIASVAEEVENPDRVIPLGMLGSLAFTTVLYVVIVAVVVGVLPLEAIAAKSTAEAGTPIADAAAQTLGTVGVWAVVLAAILALVSTANAGILSASRYPFAMSRDQLAPGFLSVVSERFGTPASAISVTGAVMLVLIAFVPILEIAKLASAFKILVFAIINVALIAFRESDAPEYDPSFHTPLYPWVQVFGVVTSLALLTQMGTLPMVGAVVITVGSVVWYVAYVRPRVSREGAMRESLRETVGQRALDRTREQLAESQGTSVLVALPEGVDERTERTLLQVAAGIVREEGGSVVVVQFDQVPDQQPLDYATGVKSESDVEFERRTGELAADLDVPVEYGEVVSHDPKRAVVNAAEDLGVDLLVLDEEARFGGYGVLADSSDWIEDHAPCDTLTVRADLEPAPSTVTLVATQGPHDPLKVRVGNALARSVGADLRLVYPVESSSSTEQRSALREYHDQLAAMSSVPTTSTFVEDGDLEDAMSTAYPERNVVLLSREGGIFARRTPPERRTREAARNTRHGLIQIYPVDTRPGFLERIWERAAF